MGSRHRGPNRSPRLVRAHRPSRPTKSVKFRKLKSIDHSSFCSDLANLPLVINTADDCESILHQYDIGLISTLDRHAPVIKRTFTVRPDNPWDSEDLHAARRFDRKLERRWKVTRLSIDKELMQRSLHERRSTTLSLFFSTPKLLKTVKRSHFQTSRLPNTCESLRIPNYASLTELVERFRKFFISKIAIIRADLDTVKQNTESDRPLLVAQF